MSEEKSISIKDEYDIVSARSVGKQMAAEIGLGIVDQSRIATAVSELARNIVLYAGTGAVTFRRLNDGGRSGLEIVASDSGPGIADIELAMQDGYTSGNGLGVGLPGTKRLMDEFEIKSEVGKGTRVMIRKWGR
ncbi:anti-sigma regulatory factor [Dehalococcoidia bacterium]|nr:anti-sigma regulatory factor [Dehalococcoidia bacterium]MCL0048022.1 anti-sigma regulatory factor [Dehalococcoidia bacterium]MCL0095199.1 anti-sigma regulatory factor [Dehalococcoidia bacterium]